MTKEIESLNHRLIRLNKDLKSLVVQVDSMIAEKKALQASLLEIAMIASHPGKDLETNLKQISKIASAHLKSNAKI